MDKRFKEKLTDRSHSVVLFTAIVTISLLIAILDLEKRNNQILERLLTCQDQVDFAKEIDSNVNEIRAYVGMNPKKVNPVCNQQ